MRTPSGALEESIRRAGLQLGFDRVGFAPVDPEQERAAHSRFTSWIEAGHAAGMSYLERGSERRRSVTSILPAARSVVVALRSYNHARDAAEPGQARISRYAAGRDYHKVVERGLAALAAHMQAGSGEGHRHRYYVDTGAILERHWAERAGVSWIGKNTCAIDPELGSYFFIGVILTTLTLQGDQLQTDHCGSCTRCLEACPTDAFESPHVLDSRRCIAYWNVEHRGAFPPGVAEQLGAHAFGCDICQEVCPWNREDRTAHPRDETLAPVPARRSRDPLELARDLVADPEEILRASAMRRAKRQGLLRNVAAVLANLGRRDALSLLDELSADSDEVVAGAAAGAARRLRNADPESS